MRKVPELRFDGFDGEWEEKILENCIKLLKSGLSRKLSDYDIGVPVVRANNTFNNKLDIDNDVKYWYEDDPQGANTDNYAIQKNDILINFINSKSKMGTAAIVETIPNRKTIYTTNIMRVVLSDDLNPYYFLMITLTTSYRKYIDAISMPAVNQSSFTTADYKKLKFNSPCIDEQERIGDLFKKLDDLIEIQEGKVAKMEDFKKSMLQKMFPKKGELVPEFRFDGFDSNWLLSRLGEVTSLRGGYAFKSQNYIENGIPILRISNINANGTTNEDYVYYTEISNDDNISLDNGAIVLAMSGATTGKISILKTQGKVYQNQRVGYFTKSDIVDYLYLSVILRSHLFTSQLDKILITGAQPNISSKDVENFSFKFPSLEEQQKIGKFFKNLDAQIENEEKLLESYKNMKKSLLQKMFV